MSDFFSNYLDYNYHITPLRKTYAFDPIPKDLEEKFHGNVLGIEAPLWTEWVSNQKRLDWQVFPRLVAMAENAWTKSENKNYDAFRERLEGFYKVLDLYGVNYAHSNEVDPSRLRRFLTLFKIFSNKTFDD
jgi:hexosaminidase